MIFLRSWILSCMIQHVWMERLSPGCGKTSPVIPGEIKKFEFLYEDKYNGPVLRNYLIQIPPEYNKDLPFMLVFDLHGYTGSAVGQSHSPWKEVGKRQNFIVVWPDGMHDSPHQLGSWNCSNSNGPKGHPCVIERDNWKKFECYDSCPLCNEMNTCDWTSCHDDIGFIDLLQAELTDKFCIDLDSMHLSGMSNGGIFAYYLAAHATDVLGFATINPVASSALLGFGSPPPTQVQISIIDMHGFQDKLIPMNEHSSVGNGPYGSLLSVWGWYFEEKESLFDEWKESLDCQTDTIPYATNYDNIDNFQCILWICRNGQDLVRCTGDFGHEYPLHSFHFASAEIAADFMRTHPRQS